MVAHELAAYLASQVETAIIFLGEQTEITKQPNGLITLTIESSAVEEFAVPNLARKNVRAIFEFLDEFQPDIIHAHEPALLSVLGQVWCKQHNRPFVHTSHVLPWSVLDFGALDAAKISNRYLIDKVTSGFLLNFYQNCDALIALNQTEADGIRRFGYTGQVFLVPNGRHLQPFQACRYAEITTQEKLLIFIGHICGRKNQSYLLEVMKYLPGEYKLQIIGDPLDPHYEKQLRVEAKEKALNVEFCGIVDYEEISKYFEKSHLLVSASKMEVQSLVVIEALASGTPVLGLANETIDELVNEKVGGRLPKDTSPEGFAREVVRICNLPQAEYEQLCQNARQRVKDMDWENVTRMTRIAYEALRKTHPSLSPEEGRARLTRLITLLPSGQLRDYISQHSEKVTARFRQARKVDRRTWIVSGATILVSIAVYLFLRQRDGFRRWRKNLSSRTRLQDQ